MSFHFSFGLSEGFEDMFPHLEDHTDQYRRAIIQFNVQRQPYAFAEHQANCEKVWRGLNFIWQSGIECDIPEAESLWSR